jgi:hypothetical protein
MSDRLDSATSGEIAVTVIGLAGAAVALFGQDGHAIAGAIVFSAVVWWGGKSRHAN